MAKINLFNIGTTAASVLGLGSIAIDAHSRGKLEARKGQGKATSDKYVRDMIGASKLNDVSEKHAAIKDFIADGNVTDKFHEFGGAVGGYFSGVGKTLWNNIFTTAFGLTALAAKSKIVKTGALIGMGISMVIDTIVNGTSLFDRKDYLDK